MLGCERFVEVAVAAAMTMGFVGCGGNTGGDAGTDDGTTTSGTTSDSTSSTPTTSTGSTAGSTGSADTIVGTKSSSGEDESGPDGSTSTGEETSDPFCDDERLPTAALLEDAGNGWGDVAGDFSVETTFGTWTLADNFTGCDNYIFVNDQGSSDANGLRNTATTELFERSARNVHYFFLTTSGDATEGADAWQSSVGGALAGLPDDAQQHWAERVHFVTDMSGSTAEFFAARPDQITAGIDRAQTWDDPGSVRDTTSGAFAPSAPVLGYTGRYYNYRYAQDLALAAQREVTEVVVLDEHTFEPECEGSCAGLPDGPFANSNNWAVWPAEFPDANTMAQFDTMEVIVTAQCGPSHDADCGHWDYEAILNLCDDDQCGAASHELARWITPYARPGARRWVFEASPLLGLVAGGGTQYVQFGMIWNMNPSVWDVRVRLRNTGKNAASREVLPAFTGNRTFNDEYNTWETVGFTPPEGTTKVELVAILSGHGQDSGNCSEWCEHQHEFTINGATEYLREFPADVAAQRCGEAVDEGVVPGQWGNWTPGRAGWCPGLPVQPWIVDITDDVTVGQPNTIDYRGLFNDAPVTGNRGRIRLSSYIVFSD